MRSLIVVLMLLMSGVSWAVVTPQALAAPGDMTRVNVASDGTQANGGSYSAALSGDGRFVAFHSEATNLVPGDTNDSSDIFVHDLQTGVTERVSVDTLGNQANGDSHHPTISGDGRVVAFYSNASNLVPGDTNNQGDAFVHDRLTGVTERVSVRSDGSQVTDTGLYGGNVSADGRFVAFLAGPSMLDSPDASNTANVFVHDRVTRVTELVSVALDGTPAYFSDGGGRVSISGDGRFVAFQSAATNLGAHGVGGIFVRDRQAGTTRLVSVTSDGIPARDGGVMPAISADGHVVAFHSWSPDLLRVPSPSPHGVYVHDLRSGVTEQVNVAPNGLAVHDWSERQPAVSADGRFVAFDSDATELSPHDLDNTWDVFVRDRALGATTLVSVGLNDTAASSGSNTASISADGRMVSFISFADNLVPGDTNGAPDVFVAEVDMTRAWYAIGDPLFERTWSRTDRPVAEASAGRTWMWGPALISPKLSELYVDSPGGERVVQYFDKARMELTYPDIDQWSPWAVTNGLLVVELMTGQMQVGHSTFEQRQPSAIPIAGDLDDPNEPTYATFAGLRDASPLARGAPIIQVVDRAGNVTNDPSLAAEGVRAGPFISETGHRVASVFRDFLHAAGTVYEGGGYSTERLFEPWFYASGLPITEAYWATVRVDGVERLVLVQAFERRVLTYTPSNPEGWRVEAGNVGQHYYQWRYGHLAQPSSLIADGHTVWTQYFERAVFEWHPDNAEPYRVLLRRLGAEMLVERGW